MLHDFCAFHERVSSHKMCKRCRIMSGWRRASLYREIVAFGEQLAYLQARVSFWCASVCLLDEGLVPGVGSFACVQEAGDTFPKILDRAGHFQVFHIRSRRCIHHRRDFRPPWSHTLPISLSLDRWQRMIRPKHQKGPQVLLRRAIFPHSICWFYIQISSSWARRC